MTKSILNTEEKSNQKRNRPFVIGIAGACGSGKTWFANKLKDEFVEPVCVFTLDSYSKGEDFVNGLEFRYDNPQAIDYDKAYEDLSKLLHGLSVTLPIYDYSCHRIISEKTCESPSVIIIEGLYAFYDNRFLKSMDFKIWIETDEKMREKNRVKRDMNERGASQEESLFRHKYDSEPAYRKYYINGRDEANCIYHNNFEDIKSPSFVKALQNFKKRYDDEQKR